MTHSGNPTMSVVRSHNLGAAITIHGPVDSDQRTSGGFVDSTRTLQHQDVAAGIDKEGVMFFGSCNCNPRLKSRRDLLCAGGAGFVSALISTMIGSGQTARAE